MATKRTKKDYVPHRESDGALMCEAKGCKEHGLYKAPKSRKSDDGYQWLCLEHIREYNQKWDYFSGMEADEIEAFMRDAITGHRPTWTREGRARNVHAALQDALYEFMHDSPRPSPRVRALAPKLRRALALFELEYPFTQRTLKMRYRELVKKHHPDKHKGDKEQEEKFKQVATAFTLLEEHLTMMDKR